MFLGKAPTEELSTYYDVLFNVKKEDRAEAQMYRQQLRSSSAFLLFRSDMSYLQPHRGGKSHLRPYSGIKFYLQRDVDGEVHHQLDGLQHLQKEGHAFLKFLTINFTSGASEVIRECESENEYETSNEEERSLTGGRAWFWPAQSTASSNRSRATGLFKKGPKKKALCKVLEVGRMSGSLCSAAETRKLCVHEQPGGSCFVSWTVVRVVTCTSGAMTAHEDLPIWRLIDDEEE